MSAKQDKVRGTRYEAIVDSYLHGHGSDAHRGGEGDAKDVGAQVHTLYISQYARPERNLGEGMPVALKRHLILCAALVVIAIARLQCCVRNVAKLPKIERFFKPSARCHVTRSQSEPGKTPPCGTATFPRRINPDSADKTFPCDPALDAPESREATEGTCTRHSSSVTLQWRGEARRRTTGEGPTSRRTSLVGGSVRAVAATADAAATVGSRPVGPQPRSGGERTPSERAMNETSGGCAMCATEGPLVTPSAERDRGRDRAM
eukprot:scaffold1_cov402-Prasinococcus_capsulatus_cf.AAC.16